MQLYLIHRNKHREAAKSKRQIIMSQMKERIKTPEKELNKMEIGSLSDAEFKTLVIRMPKELSEDLKSIEKIQSGMKVTLIEIQNICRETTVEWMKPRIKSVIWNIRNQKTNNQNDKKKKESKNMSIV